MNIVKVINFASIFMILIFLVTVILMISKNQFKTSNSFEIGFIVLSVFVILTLIGLTSYINSISKDIKNTIYNFRKFPSKEEKESINEFIFWSVSIISFSVCIGLIVILVLLSEKKYYKSNISEIFLILVSVLIIIYILFLLVYMIFYLKNEHLKTTITFNKHKNKVLLDNITNFKNPLFNKNGKQK